MKSICQITIIMVTVTIFIQACSDPFALFEPTTNSDPLVLIVSNNQDSTSQHMSNHIIKTLDYAHLPHIQKDVSIAELIEIPGSIRVMYLTTDVVEEISDKVVTEIVRFVAEGKQLVVMAPLYDERFAYLIGLKENTEYITSSEAEGFHFFDDVFPHYAGAKFKATEPFRHFGFERSQFVADTNVIASAQTNPDYPAIIERKIGQGSVIYFNTLVMNEKDYRGLTFTAGLKALEGIPYRVANVSTIFLDDFPAPLYRKKMAPIDAEYNITHADFVTDVWWPDMKRLAEQFDIDYTALLAFNYNAVVVPPFDFQEWENVGAKVDGKNHNASSLLARDIKDSRHELGFHGYNHFSLWEQDWPNSDFMESSLKAAKKRWNIDNLGAFPVTYVPPTNNIDSTGLAVVKEAMPSVKYMSSLYLGSVEEGGGREFGPDPVNSDFFAYPRITSGFVNSDISNFDQQNLFLYAGIWTHFVHPDDVFQVTQRDEDNYKSRNPLGLGWHSNEIFEFGLYEVFEQRLRETLQRFPIIRFPAAREAAPIVQNWLQTQSSYTINEESINVTTRSVGSGYKQKFWFNYVNDENQDKIENALTEAGISFSKSTIWDGALYQFSTTADTLELPVFRQKESDEALTNKIVAEHKIRMASISRDQLDPVQWRDTRLEDVLAALEENPNKKELQDSLISLAVEFDTVQLAIPILEERVADSLGNEEDIDLLLKLYGWRGEGTRAYNFADTLWEKYQNERVLDINQRMMNMFGSSNVEFERKWLGRKLKLNPEDPEALQKMVQLSNSWMHKKLFLEDLVTAHPTSDSLLEFTAEYYIANDELGEFTDLIQSDIRKGEQIAEYAPQIAYHYASKGDLTRAGMWAVNTDSIPEITKLNWLIQQKRYGEFITESEKYVKSNPADDSLRKYVGQQLIYEGFYDRGYDILYPLFEQQSVSSQTEKLVQNEINYMNYPDQKRIYEIYPAFFSNEQRDSIRNKYREFEGLKSGTSSRFSSDNYSQNSAEVGFFFEWGNRQDVVHQITLNEKVLGTDIPELSSSNSVDLFHLYYQYRQNFRNQTKQLTLGGGLFSGKNIYPQLNAEYWWIKNNTYTSSKLSFSPLFTAPAVQQNIHHLKSELYRDYSWPDKKLESALMLNSSWYTDSNFSYEVSSKFYFNWPISTPERKIRPMVDISFENAMHTNSSGLPYYTPDRLLQPGAGVNLGYKDTQYDPDFSLNLELIYKTSNQNENFIVSSGNIRKRFLDFWEFSLQGYLSTSKVYRYNSIELNLSYILPNRK